jgi:hypothetical protein
LQISTTNPTTANGGDMFIVDLAALPNAKDVRVDRYMWWNDGRKKYPKNKNSVMYKSIYKIKLPDKSYSNNFQKHV